ncbi:MAG: helix-turn-helix domain-containing protein [Acidimicrobiia bacterium]|nr:helix-turn-helix domain-containing protein [Acidimicrobiia bacterium]
MRSEHPLTLTVEEAGRALGVGRSTAYELVRSGDLASIRLRRRIVVPTAHVAEQLGVTLDQVRAALWPITTRAATPTTAERVHRAAVDLDSPRLF